jgi:hypothetical protein
METQVTHIGEAAPIVAWLRELKAMMILAMATRLTSVGRVAWLKGGLSAGLHPSETGVHG